MTQAFNCWVRLSPLFWRAVYSTAVKTADEIKLLNADDYRLTRRRKRQRLQNPYLLLAAVLFLLRSFCPDQITQN
jgi:FHS family L-fucose permease-like MFS transporter